MLLQAGDTPEVDAVVLAGGKLSGWFARSAGTRARALAPVAVVPMARRVAEALLQAPAVRRVVLAGQPEVREACPAACLWVADQGSAPANTRAALRELRGSSRPVLICAADTPFLTAAAVMDLLRRSPDAALCLPLVSRERFRAAYPGNPGIYVRLREGAFTAGCQILVRPRAAEGAAEMLERLHRRRKSQLAMAAALGGRCAWRLIAGRLSIAEIAARLGALLGCSCAAVTECAPELAFDVDNVFDWWYACRHAARAGHEG
jgi:CTP:molybdopterin cytidylyltransferase MocA